MLVLGRVGCRKPAIKDGKLFTGGFLFWVCRAFLKFLKVKEH